VLGELLKLKGGVESGSVVHQSGYSYNVPEVPVTLTTETVAQWIELCTEGIAAKQESRKREAEVAKKKEIDWTAAWIAQPDEKIILQERSGVWSAMSPYSFAPSMRAQVRERLAKAQLMADRLNSEAAEKTAKAAAAKAAAATRRSAQLADWLKKEGSDSMRKRASRGLLPEEDLIAAIRNEAFAPLGGFKRFERMTDEEVRQAVDAAGFEQTVVYETSEADTAHDEDIELMEQIEALVPGATCTLMAHEGKLDDDDQDVSLMRYSVRVEIKVGEFEFSREYSAEHPEMRPK
jgi:hypothetical protein